MAMKKNELIKKAILKFHGGLKGASMVEIGKIWAALPADKQIEYMQDVKKEGKQKDADNK